MGADCSPEQVDLIVRHVKPSGRRFYIITEDDAAGYNCAIATMQQVGRSRFVRRVAIEHGQPTNYTQIDLL